MSWREAEMADGTAAQVAALDNGELDMAEPWTTLKLTNGQELLVPTEAFFKEGGVYRLPMTLQELGLELNATPETTVIPIIEEEIEVGRRQINTASVSINTRLETQQAVIDDFLLTETVDVERVAMDREVSGPQPVRYEGDLVIIPVIEEVLVVTKRFVLKEEIRVRRRSADIPTRQEVTLRRQTAEVVRQPLDEA